jgi:transposase-like protein
MNGSSLGVALSSGGLAADPVPASRPDPEVVAKAKRRTYPAGYKQRILQEAEVAATTRGGLGALLRREGLYSSLLTYWRRERAHGILAALTPQKRGPKSKRNPMEEELQKLRRENACLTEDLALCMPRASYYRDGCKTSSPAVSASRPSPTRVLRPAEREVVVARLHEERFQDRDCFGPGVRTESRTLGANPRRPGSTRRPCGRRASTSNTNSCGQVSQSR